MIIEILSRINNDGYFTEGHYYTLSENDMNELVTLIKRKSEKEQKFEIEFLKGKNTFTGNIISDKFYNDMKERLLNLL